MESPVVYSPSSEARFPGIVKAAGIIWIVVGSLMLLCAAVLAILCQLLTVPVDVAELLVVALFGGVFILVGVQTVRGTAVDTLGNGIGSICFGLLYGGLSLNLQSGGVGLALLVAGILALVGRSDYKAWRRAQKAMKSA